MNTAFQAFIAAMTNDDGTGETGDLMTKSWWTDLMSLIDSEISSQGGVITTDTTYYVSASSGDDSNDGSVTAPWATLTHALDTLRPYRIKPGVTVTVQLDDGTYIITESISDLPEGITISGKNIKTPEILSVYSGSGSSGGYTVVLSLDDVTGITTDDYILIYNASGGTHPEYLPGVWDITSVDTANARITITTSHVLGRPSGAVTASAIVFKSSIFAVGCTGVSDCPIVLSSLCLRGDNTSSTYGIYTSHVATAASLVGVYNFGSHGAYVAMTGGLSLSTSALSHHGGDGIYNTRGGTVSAYGGEGTFISGNGGDGIDININATLQGVMQISGNGGYGINANFAGVVRINSGSRIDETNAVYARSSAYVQVGAIPIVGTVSPALNTQGNGYAYVES